MDRRSSAPVVTLRSRRHRQSHGFGSMTPDLRHHQRRNLGTLHDRSPQASAPGAWNVRLPAGRHPRNSSHQHSRTSPPSTSRLDLDGTGPVLRSPTVPPTSRSLATAGNRKSKSRLTCHRCQRAGVLLGPRRHRPKPRLPQYNADLRHHQQTASGTLHHDPRCCNRHLERHVSTRCATPCRFSPTSRE